MYKCTTLQLVMSFWGQCRSCLWNSLLTHPLKQGQGHLWAVTPAKQFSLYTLSDPLWNITRYREQLHACHVALLDHGVRATKLCHPLPSWVSVLALATSFLGNVSKFVKSYCRAMTPVVFQFALAHLVACHVVPRSQALIAALKTTESQVTWFTSLREEAAIFRCIAEM